MEKNDNHSVRIIEDASCCYRRINGDAIRLIWEVTGRCNLHCHHCFANISGMQKPGNELNTDEALAIVDQLSRANIGKVMITGGEPFVRKDLTKILAAIRSANPDMLIDITTNGTLIHDEMLDLLKAYQIDELSVSFDGCKDVYCTVRETKSAIYERLLRTLKRAVSLGIKIDGILVLTKETVSGLHDALVEAQKIGFSSFSISRLLTLPHSDFDYSGLALNDDELDEMLEKIKGYQKEFEGKMVVRTVGFTSCAGENCSNKSIIAINRAGEYTRCLNYYHDQSLFLDSRTISLKEALDRINGTANGTGK